MLLKQKTLLYQPKDNLTEQQEQRMSTLLTTNIKASNLTALELTKPLQSNKRLKYPKLRMKERNSL